MNDEDLGLVIDDIRRNRNITIEALCEGIISPSTYSRFVKGKTFLSSRSFMKLVFRLHMTFAMFLQDYQDFFRIKHHYTILSHAKSHDDIDLIRKLMEEYQARQGQEDWRIHDKRFLEVVTALISHLENSSDCHEHLITVQNHLKSLKILTDNDFFGLRLLLPYMTLKDADAIVKKTLKQLTDLKEPSLAENLYYVCGVMYIKSLQAKQEKQAAAYYKLLDEIYLDQIELGGKLSQQLYQNIHLYFTGETERAIDQLNKLSAFYSELNLSHHSRYVAETCRDLHIPIQEVEVF